MGAALQRFRELPTLVTPLAKAACLRDTVQLIFVAIQQLSESSVEVRRAWRGTCRGRVRRSRCAGGRVAWRWILERFECCLDSAGKLPGKCLSMEVWKYEV